MIILPQIICIDAPIIRYPLKVFCYLLELYDSVCGRLICVVVLSVLLLILSILSDL